MFELCAAQVPRGDLRMMRLSLMHSDSGVSACRSPSSTGRPRWRLVRPGSDALILTAGEGRRRPGGGHGGAADQSLRPFVVVRAQLLHCGLVLLLAHFGSRWDRPPCGIRCGRPGRVGAGSSPRDVLLPSCPCHRRCRSRGSGFGRRRMTPRGRRAKRDLPLAAGWPTAAGNAWAVPLL